MTCALKMMNKKLSLLFLGDKVLRFPSCTSNSKWTLPYKNPTTYKVI